MKTVSLGQGSDAGLMDELEAKTGTDISRCLQCGKCTAGCPMDFLYDYSVNQVMRLAREGDRQGLLGCRSIWLCASCHTCSSRCPAGIDPAGVMEALRHAARREGKTAERDPGLLANAFVTTLKHWGRLYEIELMMRYNLGSLHLFNGTDLAPKALSKGKLHFVPHKAAGQGEVARIVERFEKEQGR